MKVFLTLVLVLVVVVQYGQAKVEPLMYLPPELQSSLDICHSTGDLRNKSGQIVLWSSIQLYISKFAQSTSNLSVAETRLFESALYEILTPLLEPAARRKRQVTDTRVRQEVRAMSITARNNYFAAVNAMKRDRRLTPNVYDVIAGLHSGANIGRAHGGPAFGSWHRLYIFIFESLLRLWYDPTVTLPFWASTMDQPMADPTQSAIWSDEFFGNGNGIVTTGRFADWRFLPGQPIRRNIGGNTLMTYAQVDRVLSRDRNFQIFKPTALPQFDFEDFHGGPHVFVGGTMNNLFTAAFDPIFYSHHCFVDYIWERFRIQQRDVGVVDPEMDYPFDSNDPRFRPSHAPDATAGFAIRNIPSDVTVLGIQLAALTQRIGYSNQFFDLVQYQETPTCPDCASSQYLYCETSIGRCVGRNMNDIVPLPPSVTTTTTTTTQDPPTTGFPTFAPSTSPPSPQPPSQRGSCSKQPFINDVDTKQMSGTGDWAYIPVNVVAKRADSLSGFDEYSLYKTHSSWANQSTLGYKYEFTKSGVQYEYEGCSKKQGIAGKITIVSWGLNYDGYAEEAVIVDNRFGVSQGNGFLPVKKPTYYEPSEFITVAYDTCGRVCKPYCNNRNHAYINDHFSGGFKLSVDSPKQYSNSYEEAMLSMWEILSPSFSPIIDYNDIPITFFCEYTDIWIWDRPPTPTQSPPTQPTTKSTTFSYPSYEPNYQQSYPLDQQSYPPANPRYPPLYQQNCLVATDCMIDVPCSPCEDFDYKYCRGEKKIAICINGKFSITATTEAHINHFYNNY